MQPITRMMEMAKEDKFQEAEGRKDLEEGNEAAKRRGRGSSERARERVRERIMSQCVR